jgi:hypothetical protein
MDHAHGHGHEPESLNRVAFGATWHCLTGCAIGEVLGLVIATALGWGNVASIAIAVVLAFLFGYALTLRPLVTGGVPLRRAARIALAADTVSITVMEIVDNGFVLLAMRIHTERAARLLSAIRPVATPDMHRVTANAVADRPAETSAGAYSRLHARRCYGQEHRDATYVAGYDQKSPTD